MAEIDRLTVVFDARFDKLEEKLNKAVRATYGAASKMEKRFDQANDNIAFKFGKGIGNVAGEQLKGLSSQAGVAATALEGFGLAGLGAAAAIGALGASLAAGRKALAFADDIGDTAARIGVTTDTLQEFRYAIHQVGGEAADADEALAEFTKTLGKAQTPLATAKTLKPFAALGLDPKALGDVDQALNTVLDKLSKVQNEAQRQALAKALGLDKFILLAREGAQRTDELRAAAHRLGYVMDADLIAKAGEANDKLEDLNQVLKVQLASTFAELAPLILEVAGALNTAAKALAGFVADPKLQHGLKLISGYVGAVGKGGMIGGAKFVASHFDEINQVANTPSDIDWSKFVSPNREMKMSSGNGGVTPPAPKPARSVGRTRTARVDNGPTAEELARTRDIAEFRERIELAREVGDKAATQALDDQLDRLQKIAEYRKDGLDLAQATAKADAFMAARNLAREAGAIRQGPDLDGFISAEDRIAKLNADFAEAGQSASEFGDLLHNSLDNLADGLADAIVNAHSLGDVAKNVFRQMVADLLAAAIKKDIVTPLIGLIPGFASGTSSAPGGLALVGEQGPELVNLPRGSSVTPSSQTLNALKTMSLPRAAGPAIVQQTLHFDNRGAVMTDDLLRQMGAMSAQAKNQAVAESLKLGKQQLPDALRAHQMLRG